MVGRFGVRAGLPQPHVMGDAPGNDDGRSFALDGGYSVALFGSYQIWALEEYHALRRDWIIDAAGQITHDAEGADWVVLSGRVDGSVFYLRDEAGEDPSGDPVWVHMRADDPVDGPGRAAHDAMTAGIAASLGDC